MDTTVVLHGSGFNYTVQVDLDQSSPPLQRDFSVTIGTWPAEQEFVEYIDSTRIKVTIPANRLAVGWHRVEIESPTRAHASLERALEIEAPSIPGKPAPAPAPIDAAIAMAADDGGKAPPPPPEDAGPPEIDASAPDDAGLMGETNPTLTDAGDGSAALPADDASAKPDAASTTQHTLHLETAPDGSGDAIVSAALSADQTLKLFAIERNGQGQFVANVSATFSQSGDLGLLSPTQGQESLFTATTPGSGELRATHSTLGSVRAGLAVSPGRAVTLSVVPFSGQLTLADPPFQFSVEAFDEDGNPTEDFGTLTWEVDSGNLPGFDVATGLLSPLAEGSGTLRVRSSDPVLEASSGEVTVVAAGGVAITDVQGPAATARGTHNLLFTVNVNNTTVDQAWLTGDWLEFSQMGVLDTSSFAVAADSENPESIEPGETGVLRYWVQVSSAPILGSVVVTAHVQAYLRDRLALTESSANSNLLIVNVAAPLAVIGAPMPPDNRACVDAPTDFAGDGSSGLLLAYDWALPGSSVSTSAAPNPQAVTYPSPGAYAFSLTVTDSLGGTDMARGAAPIFVGQALPGAESYPAGPIIFDVGAQEKLTNLPKDMINSMTPIRRCDDVNVTPGFNDYVTLWVDRGQIAPSQDALPAVPGIQVRLSKSGDGFEKIVLQNVSPQLEGPALIYGEHLHLGSGTVTAAGSQTFTLTDDGEAPTVVFSSPANNCAACLAANAPVTFGFSEPMSSELLSKVRVARSDSPCEAANATYLDITAESELLYDEQSWTLRVLPKVTTSASVRIALGPGITDQSSNANPLPTLMHCVNLSVQAPGAAPTAPEDVVQSAFPFSPDGDLTDDTVLIYASVDAMTELVRLDIYDGVTLVRSIIRPVGPGTRAAIEWDGREVTGRVLRDGFYRFTLTALGNQWQTSAPAEGVIRIDSAIDFTGVHAPK